MHATAPMVLAAGLALACPVAAQDEPPPLWPLSTAGELVAVLDAEESRAIAYINGVIGAYQWRSVTGDPLLWWVHNCLTRTMGGAEQLVPGLRAHVEDYGGKPSEGTAPNAILDALAGFCAEAIGEDEVTLPE